MQIEVSSLFSLPDGLEMTSMAVVGNVLTIHVTATAKSRPCPLCTQEAPHVRSYYTRLVADVPCAARQGAPQAVQTADRFHLCKNLAEAVEKALARCRAELRKDRKAKETFEATSPEEPPPSPLTSDGQPYSAHQTERYDRYQQVVALRDQGVKIKEIAKRLGLGVRTIQGWLAQGAYPETNYHHPHRSRFDAYEAYVRRRRGTRADSCCNHILAMSRGGKPDWVCSS